MRATAGARSARERPRPDCETALAVTRRPRLDVWSRDAAGGVHHGTSALVGSEKRPFAAASRTPIRERRKKRFRDRRQTRANFLTRRFTGLFCPVIIQSRKSPKRRSVAAPSDKAPGAPRFRATRRRFFGFRAISGGSRRSARTPPGALASSTPTERNGSRERRTFVPVPLPRPLHASRSNVLVHPRASSRADVNRRLGDYVSKQIRPTSVGPSPLSPPFSPPGAPAWLSSPL